MGGRRADRFDRGGTVGDEGDAAGEKQPAGWNDSHFHWFSHRRGHISSKACGHHGRPSVRLFQEGAILVNRRGRRFVDELKNPAFALAKQPGNTAYVVFDDRIARKFSGWPYFISTAPGIAYAYLADYGRYRRDIFHSSRSLEGLARSIDVPRENFLETISRCNTGNSGRSTIKVPPYFALGPAKSWIMTTDGSLEVTANLEVMDESGAPIPGLYTAGSVGQGGLLIPGHGQHLGWAFTSGRLAARAVAKNESGQTRR